MTNLNISKSSKATPLVESDSNGGCSFPNGTGLLSTCTLTRVLDELNVAIILTDLDARVCYANSAAKDLVNTGGGVRIVQGVLKTGSEHNTIRLSQLIEKAARNADEPSSQTRHFGLSLGESRDGCFRTIVVVGLSSANAKSGQGQVRAILFIAQNDQETQIPEGILRSLFDLTESEAALAIQLAEGKGVAFAARGSSIGINTARTHLKRIFSKTRTSRQAEFVRVLLKSVGYVRFG